MQTDEGWSTQMPLLMSQTVITKPYYGAGPPVGLYFGNQYSFAF